MPDEPMPDDAPIADIDPIAPDHDAVDSDVALDDTGAHQIAVKRNSTSRWVIRPTGLLIAVGIMIGGYVLSSIIGDGSPPTTADGNQATSLEVTPTTASVASPGAAGSATPPSTSPVVLPSATSAPPQGTASAAEPKVVATGLREPCKFGADCIIVSFEVVNFESTPTEFTCEFANGSYTFAMRDRTSVDRACMSGDSNDSITIVVNGIRSETISRDNIG